MFKPSRSDARLLERALRQGWNIPPKMRTRIIKALGEILDDEKSTRREKTSAARALMQASRIELDAIQVAEGALYENLVDRMETLESEFQSDGKLAKVSSKS
jgi:hypothetical protein